MRNCPGIAESAGKPPAFGSQTPGVVRRQLRVVVEAPAFHLGGVGFARTGYPRTYTQSSFFAGMWHTLQSVL